MPRYDDDYHARNFNYVRALDQLARQKAKEILEILSKETWKPPVLDIGGGIGKESRQSLQIFVFTHLKMKKPLVLSL